MERVNPSGITYSQGAIPLGTPAKSSVRKFYPKNGRDFSPTGTNIIQLPLYAEGQFMDCAGHSFLKFEIHNSSGSKDLKLGGGGAHCWIKRLRVLSATGQQLEDIDDYNALHGLLQDLTVGEDHLKSALNVKSGAGKMPANTVGMGEGASGVYTINVVSGLLMQPKYLPLLMTKGGLLLELTLEDANKAFVWETGTTDAGYQIKNLEYVAELVDFGPEFNSNFIQMMAGAGGALLSGVTYRNHTNTVKDSDRHIDITERSRSIKSIITMMRTTAKYENQPTRESLSDRIVPKELQGYQYRVGSITYPEHFVKVTTAAAGRNVSEAACHLFKALGSALTDVRHGTVVTETNFAFEEPIVKVEDTTRSTYGTTAVADIGNVSVPNLVQIDDQRCTGALAVSLESFAKDSSKLESGLNSAAQALPVRLDLDHSVNFSAGNIRANTYVMCDALFNFLPNGDVVASV